MEVDTVFLRPKNFRIKRFILYLIIGFAYPLFAYFTRENKLLTFCNASLIVGLLFVALGILAIAFLHGDLDITGYVFRRFRNKENMKPFDAYKEDKNESREGSFNYPLLIGLILIAASAVTSVLYSRP